MARDKQTQTGRLMRGKPSARERGRGSGLRQGGLILGLLAVLVVGAFVFWPRPTPAAVSAVRLADDPALGPATAKVTIIEYGDFGCTTCRAWQQAGVLSQMRAKYGDKVR